MKVFARRVAALALSAALVCVAPLAANEAPTTGPVTKLPIPRFVSMKADEGNVRRGPSLSHRIDWVFRHRGMPLEVIGEFGHWRRVRDSEGAGGWMHYTLLSGVRTVIVQEDMTALLLKPLPNSEARAQAEAGVIARLEQCTPDWCRIKAESARGWVPKTTLWGVLPDEIRD